MNQSLADQIDAILPQTQCGKCGFSGCKPYAEAIVQGHADINQCPPGNQEGIQKIAQLLNIPEKPLNTDHGQPSLVPVVALINEQLCIGCTFCLRACPVDAIVGAAKQLHTVIAAECTGCELCIAPCPMDCISLIPAKKNTEAAFKKQAADRARTRFQFRQQRLAHSTSTNNKGTATKAIRQSDLTQTQHDTRKQTIISAALKRAAALRTQQQASGKSPHKPV